MSTEKNKTEKAGAEASAIPSKVEGTQPSDQSTLDLNSTPDLQTQIETLQNELSDKDKVIISLQGDLTTKDDQIISLNDELKVKLDHIADLESEFKAFKDKLKPEIEKIQTENKDLKGQVEKLQGKLVKSGGKTEPLKTDGKFTVINSFRSNQDGEGIFNIGDDVSHLSAERLKSLVDRELVKEG